jgi:uncharacterized membrane protein YqjE
MSTIQAPGTGGQGGGMFDSLKELARTAVEALHSRLDLLVTEIAEEQSRITELLVVGAIALLCLFLAIVFAAFFVVVAFWDSPYRLLVPGLMAAVLLAASVMLWLHFRRTMRAKRRLFDATLEEVGADLERLR